MPPPQIMFEIFSSKNGAFWLHFLPYARFFRSSKGGRAWPKWPNGKYAYGSDLGGELAGLELLLCMRIFCKHCLGTIKVKFKQTTSSFIWFILCSIAAADG